MIAILSQEVNDDTCDSVIDWLVESEVKYLRINGDIHQTQAFSYNLKDPLKHLRNISVIWYRRWWRSIKFRSQIADSKLNINNSIALYNFIKNEHNELTRHLLQNIKAIHVDNLNEVLNLNKLDILQKASKIGLKIPETLITNNKKDLINFIKTFKNIITKTIKDVSAIETKDAYYTYETLLVTEDAALNAEDVFFPSLFQKQIEKLYELRVFCLNKQFYTMAILSQRRKEASIDYRNYNFSDPDRMVPYKLPSSLQVKLVRLVNKLNLKHCSIDLIVTKKLDYIFLEINPVGQFGMVSDNCNYNLEKQMANFLKQTSNG